MRELYPLRFHSILRRYLWGGRRLETLGKALGPGNDYAESWEIVDHGADQSVAADGPLEGHTLHELIGRHGQELFGRHAPLPTFPLLFKFLDAHDRLSVQVHPDDERAARMASPDAGKTEAWVIMAADQGSYLYAGLRSGLDRARLERALTRDACEECLERVEPRAGDCFFLPAGVVHALGPGLLVAEIQQSSDTTFRLFDWNRLGPDGKPRALHVEAALDAIRFDVGPVAAQRPQATADGAVEQLVACDKFVLDRWTFSGTRDAGGDDRCHILAVVDGVIEIQRDSPQTLFARGGVLLLPASVGRVPVRARDSAVMLDIYLP
jgi:mannose-6-phosphate isomerase